MAKTWTHIETFDFYKFDKEATKLDKIENFRSCLARVLATFKKVKAAPPS